MCIFHFKKEIHGHYRFIRPTSMKVQSVSPEDSLLIQPSPSIMPFVFLLSLASSVNLGTAASFYNSCVLFTRLKVDVLFSHFLSFYLHSRAHIRNRRTRKFDRGKVRSGVVLNEFRENINYPTSEMLVQWALWLTYLSR